MEDICSRLASSCKVTNVKEEESAVKIQKVLKGFILRIKRIPLILLYIQDLLTKANFQFSKESDDGRINSCKDEDEIIKILTEKYPTRIRKPKSRMWFDITVYDYLYGWLPVNIKTTTTITADNTGNLAMCVYAYTDVVLELNLEKTYENGKMSEILTEKLKNKAYNRSYKKDYYFIVMNKNNSSDVIVNSVRGLTRLTPNINNLPFQIKWCQNKDFVYERIEKSIQLFIEVIKKPKPSWQEKFLSDVRSL